MTVTFAELSELYHSLRVPRLILQPIIENAFHYALENHSENGFLDVSFTVEGTQLILTIQDNGRALEDSTIALLNHKMEQDHPEGGTTGLVNVSQRLRLKYGDTGLAFSRSSYGGLQVVIRLSIE
jgi:two-component system sensor histidine kinase YesM